VRAADEDRKLFLPRTEVVASLPGRLDGLQSTLLERAVARREENTVRGVGSVDELAEALEGGAGFVYSGWSGDAAVEAEVKERTKATIRCIVDPEFRSGTAPTRCLGGGDAKHEVAWAIAY
jgi:prolyl-tRNA synthetase